MASYAQLNNAPVAKKVETIYTNRLNLFLATGEYKNQNLPAYVTTPEN